MTANKKIPALRFKEFEGEWEEEKLGNISGNIMYGLNSSAIEFDGINKYIRITDIDEDSREFQPKPLTSPDGVLEDKFKLKEGDMLFARTGASVGKSYLYKKSDGNLFFAGFLIKFSIANANPFFIYAQTLKAEYYKWVQATSMRTGQPGINAEEYKILKVYLPAIQEQQKIAGFLTAIDDKIQQLTKKKALLEQYKKGIMQQIFDQQIRFKDDDGNDYPDWEETTLGEISDNIMYGLNSAAIPFDGYNKYIRITDIDESTRQFIPNPLTSPDGAIDVRYKVKEGDILFARTGASVGKSYLYKKKDGNLFFAGFLIKFSIQNQNPYFIYTQTLTEEYNKWVQVFSMRSGQPGINAEEYKCLEIVLPCLKEQQKIADFLSGIDNKIDVVNQQLEKIKEFKKGLLQQMFV